MEENGGFNPDNKTKMCNLVLFANKTTQTYVRGNVKKKEGKRYNNNQYSGSARQ